MAGRVIAVDMDEVLVNIMPRWAARAAAHPRLGLLPTLAALPADPGELHDAVMGRDHYWAESWLGLRPGAEKDEFDALYRDDGAFYDALPPTPLALALARARAWPGAVARVHVVTHLMGDGDPVNASKLRWLARHMPGCGHHLVPRGGRKSDIMRALCPEVDTFADDSMHNVVDVLSAEGVHASEILMPRLGYNSPPPPQVEAAARASRTRIAYYGNAGRPGGVRPGGGGTEVSDGEKQFGGIAAGPG